jgi:hypothetical protein
MLRQRASSRRGRLTHRLRLGCDTRRWRRRDNRSARSRLRNGLRRWNGLHTLTSCHAHPASHDRRGGDAEPSPSDEVASGDYRPSVFFSGLLIDRVGRLVACWTVVFRHQTSPFPERLCSCGSKTYFGREVRAPDVSACRAIGPIPSVWLQTVTGVNR